MKTHAPNRHTRQRARTQGGFSLLEVVGAIVLFVGAVALISTAVVTVMSNQQGARADAALDAALADAVATVASAGFDTVVDGEAATPEPCPESSAVVVRGAQSCITVNGNGHRVSWDVVARGEGVADAVAAVEVVAGAYGSDGEVVSRRAVLTSSAPLAGSERLVRVHLAGETDGLAHIYLVRSSSRSTVVGSAAVGTGSGSVLVPVSASACTVVDPCRLAISASAGAWGYDETHFLDAAAAFGERGEVALPSGYAAGADVSATVSRRGDALVAVEAYQEGTQRRSWWTGDQPEPGSVCLWARFEDGLGEQERAFCNATGSGRYISFDTYTPDPVNFPGATLPLPLGVPITIDDDSTQPTCPVVAGQRYATASGWATVSSAGVCSSWTWGRPGKWIPSGAAEVDFSAAALTMAAGERQHAVVVYTGADARPASGYDTDTGAGLFAYPRNASSCPGWGGAGCAPSWLANPSAAAPEVAACPNAHCNSSGAAAPTVAQVGMQEGLLDTAFGTATNGPDSASSTVNATVRLSDGDILIGGSFTSVGGTARLRIARLNADGTLDTAFGTTTNGPNGTVNAISVLSDGDILIGGDFTSVGGTARLRIARLNSDGTLDTSFGTTTNGPAGTVNAISVLSDGDILIGGDFTSVGGTARLRIARLNSDGTLDTSFGTTTNGPGGTVNAISVLSDGDILIGGGFTSVGGTARLRVARLNSDGTLDTAFGTTTNGPSDGSVRVISVLSSGKILIGGSFTTMAGGAWLVGGLARLNSDGSLDTSFGYDGSNGDAGVLGGGVYDIAVRSDGDIYAAGDFTDVAGTGFSYIARFDSDGSPDLGFDTWANSGTPAALARTVEALPDGDVLIGGDFTSVGGTARLRIARLNSDGSLDPVFGTSGSGTNGSVNAVSVLSDGNILIGGGFTSAGGTARLRIARLSPGQVRLWPFRAATSESFATTFRGANPGNITWQVTAAPGAGSFETCTDSSYTSCTAATTSTSGTGRTVFWKVGGSSAARSFTIRITDTVTGKTRDETIRVTDASDYAETMGFPVELGQGESVSTWVRSLTTSGAPQTGAGPVPTSSVPAGVSISQSEAFSSGWARLTVAATTPAAATTSFVAGRVDHTMWGEATVPLVIEARAGGMTVNVTTDPTQGAAGSVSLIVTDRAGAPFQGRASLEALSVEQRVGTVRFSPAVCSLNSSGQCTVTVSAARAPAGSYTVVARAGSVEDEDGLTVTSVVRDLVAQPVEVRQGSGVLGELVVEVRDGAGEPLAGVQVNASASGLSFVGDESDAAGLARLTVSGNGASPGTPTVTVSAGAVSVSSTPVRITPAPDAISDPGLVVLTADTLGSFTVTVSGAGQGLEGVEVFASTSAASVRTTSRVTSAQNGTVVVWVLAGTDAPSSFTVQLIAAGVSRTVSVGVS